MQKDSIVQVKESKLLTDMYHQERHITDTVPKNVLRREKKASHLHCGSWKVWINLQCGWIIVWCISQCDQIKTKPWWKYSKKKKKKNNYMENVYSGIILKIPVFIFWLTSCNSLNEIRWQLTTNIILETHSQKKVKSNKVKNVLNKFSWRPLFPEHWQKNQFFEKSLLIRKLLT